MLRVFVPKMRGRRDEDHAAGLPLYLQLIPFTGELISEVSTWTRGGERLSPVRGISGLGKRPAEGGVGLPL